MNDIVFYGGHIAANFGNQQYTMRNLTFYNCGTAIYQSWSWGWTYKSISIKNCTTGFDFANADSSGLAVGSATVIDSLIKDTEVAFRTARNSTSTPSAAGSLIIENVVISTVDTAVQGPNGVLLEGGNATLNWGEGHTYATNGPKSFSGLIQPVARPATLLSGSKYYERSKPQYEHLPVSKFISARDLGARGDGLTDDTAALQAAIEAAAAKHMIVFVDAGTYKISATLYVPPGSRIVGEGFPILLATGSWFESTLLPQPALRIGQAGQSGKVELSDLIVSTRGPAAGATLIEWNLRSNASAPSGMWDVHTRIGGFAGSSLQAADCPTTPELHNFVKEECVAAYMSMHITKHAAGIYIENAWLWTADHDQDDFNNTQVSIYAGRGMLVESTEGNIWL